MPDAASQVVTEKPQRVPSPLVGEGQGEGGLPLGVDTPPPPSTSSGLTKPLPQGERGSAFPWYALAAAVVAADQASKALIMAAFQLGEGLALTGFFNLVFVFNRGAAFSFLAGAGGWQRWFFAVLALAVSAYIVSQLRKHAEQKAMCAALALVMGGAIGNVIDRFVHGAVVDFLDVHLAGWHWPAFNVADSAICIGVVVLLWLQFKESRK